MGRPPREKEAKSVEVQATGPHPPSQEARPPQRSIDRVKVEAKVAGTVMGAGSSEGVATAGKEQRVASPV